MLSSLVYLNLDEYRYGNVHGAECVPVIDILRFTPLRSMLSGGWLEDAEELPNFLRALACSRRYADLSVSLFANETAEIIEKQFCACTFTVGGKDGAPLAYLAFRGTDGTIAGWKEDFNLSYMPVIPSQKPPRHTCRACFGAARRDANICGRPFERRQPRRIRRTYHRRGRLRAHQARVQPRWPEFSGSALAAHRRARIPGEARQNRA